MARRCSRVPDRYATECDGHADCDEFEEMASGIRLTDGQPSNLPDVTESYRERVARAWARSRDQEWPRQVRGEWEPTGRRDDPDPRYVFRREDIERAQRSANRISPEEVSRAFRGLTNAPSRGVHPTMAGSYWVIDRSVDTRPSRWAAPQPEFTVDDLLRAGEEMRLISDRRDDQIDALEAGAKAAAAALLKAERVGGWRGLVHLGAIGRGVAVAMDHNYGTALRGALLDLGRDVPAPAADLEPTRGALIELA